MDKLRNGGKWDSNPGSLDCESDVLQLSYRAGVTSELRELDVLHFVIEECRHLVNGCRSNVVASVDVISLSIICVGAIIFNVNSVGFVL